MFNPFRQLSLDQLEAFVRQGYSFAVAQHYKRAFDNYAATEKTALLITPYKYLSDAEYHLNQLQDKRHASLVHLNHQTHFLRIQQLLTEKSQYLLFNGHPGNLEDVLKKITISFRDQNSQLH